MHSNRRLYRRGGLLDFSPHPSPSRGSSDNEDAIRARGMEGVDGMDDAIGLPDADDGSDIGDQAPEYGSDAQLRVAPD